MTSGSSVSRTGWLSLSLLLMVLGTAWLVLDAKARLETHRKRHPRVLSVARLLGTADLALSTTSRWLRHPSQGEPGAPFADGPAVLDNDPAGALLGTPREAFGPCFRTRPDLTSRQGTP